MKMRVAFVALVLAAVILRSPALGVDNVWTNPSSGAWETSGYWNNGTPSNHFNMLWITNGVASKIVALWDGVTPISALTVSNITVAAPGGYVNTLAVGYTTAGSPSGLYAGMFDILNGLTLSTGGALVHGVATTQVEGVSGGAFNINGGSAIISNGLFITTNTYSYIGYNNNGQMTVAGGEWLAKQVNVGHNVTSSGTLTLAGGTTSLSGLLEVGVAGTGTVWLTGGQLTTTNEMTLIGVLNTSVGRMTVSNGTWLAKNVYLGFNAGGQGTLTVAGGVANFSSLLYIGEHSGGTGTVLLTGGLLLTTNTYASIGTYGVGQMAVSGGTWLAKYVNVGDYSGSQGTLTMAGGTHQFSAQFLVASAANSTGTVWLTGGELLNPYIWSAIGYSGVGQMTVSNGNWTAQGVVVGYTVGSQGTLTIAGGTNLCTSSFEVGRNAGATGRVWLTGGQLITTNYGTYIGDSGNGQVTVSGGTWQAKSVAVGFASGSIGTLTIAGGSHSFGGGLTLGLGDSSTGSVLLTGGELNLSNSSAAIGYYGQGQMTVSNGIFRGDGLWVGSQAGSSGTLTLAGGDSLFSVLFTIGDNAGATGKLFVTGVSLVVTNSAGSAPVVVGASGYGLFSLNGGNVIVDQLFVTNGANSLIFLAGGTLTVRNGATINNAYGLNVANTLNLLGSTNLIATPGFSVAGAPGNTGNVLLAGGTLYSTNSSTTIGGFGVGRMTVSNGTWEAGPVFVGAQAGSQGALTLASGTSRIAGTLYIGSAAGATGLVLVSGGELVTTNQATYIGESGNAQMTVDGGTWRGGWALVASSSGSSGTLTINGGTNLLNGWFRVGVAAGTDGRLTLNGGLLVTTNSEAFIGFLGLGQATLNDGEWLARTMYVGYDGNTCTGRLTISGGSLALDSLRVGTYDNSIGTVLIRSGQLAVAYNTIVGHSSQGQLIVSNGLWLANTVFVGFDNAGQGTLTLAGGTNRVAGNLYVGTFAGSSGTLRLSGGELTTTSSFAAAYIGEEGTGQMTVDGGTWRGDRVEVGNSSGSTGLLTINGGTNLISGSLRLGVSVGAYGTLQLNGGLLVSTNSSTYTSIGVYGTGQATVTGGTWLTRSLYVGEHPGSSGLLTMNGGTVTLNGVFILGDYYGATGTVWMSGGQLTATNNATHIGDYGVGQFSLYGGTFRSSDLKVGQDATGRGNLTVAGGTLEMSGPLTIGEVAGSQGVLYMYGGQILATNPNASINIGTGGDASIYIGGGTVNARQVNIGDGTHSGTLYMGDGTLTGGSLVVTPSGLLQLGGGILSSLVTNQGVIQFYNNLFAFRGGLDNLATLNLPANQIVNVQGGLGNEGGVIIAGAGAVLNADRFRNNRHNGILFLNSAAQLNVTAAWTNNGAIELTQGLIGAGGAIQNASLIEGVGAVLAPVVNNAGGTVRANGGLLALAGSSVENQAGGIFEATAGSTLRINRNLLNQGFINPQGGLIDFGSNTLSNQGTLTGYGTYKAALIVNQNRATFTGSNLDLQAAYLNSGTTVVLHVTANFFGAFTNASGAYFKNTGSQVTFFGPTSIGGTYVSDPALNIFQSALEVSGILSGGEGDVFVFNSDLTSTNPDGLQLAGAKVVFNEGAHTFTLAGTAQIGELEVASGGTVNLLGGDLVVGVFNASTGQFTTAQTIYYDPAQNPDLGGQSYGLAGGGSLSPVPEPSSGLLVLLGVTAALCRRAFSNRPGRTERPRY